MIQRIFAHGAGMHVMKDGRVMTDTEHCAPILIGAAIIVVVLLAIIGYFLAAWEPKKAKKVPSAKKAKK